jgi:hypothetical protein
MSEEKEIDNLNKQTQDKTLSSYLLSSLSNKEFLAKVIKKRAEYFDVLDDETPASVIAAELVKAGLRGDKRAIELIQKIAYGDSITVKTDDSFFNKDIKITIIDPKESK